MPPLRDALIVPSRVSEVVSRYPCCTRAPLCTIHGVSDPIANHQHISTRDLRDHLGRKVDAAFYGGETTVITKNGEPRAVLISVTQYRQAMQLLAESSDPTPNTNPDPTLKETK